MFTIQFSNLSLHRQVELFVQSSFPSSIPKGSSNQLDILTDIIVGSGQIRNGPRPSPEALSAQRAVMTHYIKQDLPIPFLIGWGSEKPDGGGIDVAELFAMKTLSCLYEKVSKVYSPGVLYHIRVEDASAPHLFYDRMEQARREAAVYTSEFVNMVRILHLDHFIKVIPESTLTSESAFNSVADKILPLMEEHLRNPLATAFREQLLSYGWSNPLNPETLKFFMDRYVHLYPNHTEDQRRYILARYFVGALTRYALGITGKDPTWKNMFLELSFVNPTPGIGVDRALRRLYYRTLPEAISSTHLPPWRAKGYLRVSNQSDKVTTTLASYNDTTTLATLSSGELVLEDDIGRIQKIRADYKFVD